MLLVRLGILSSTVFTEQSFRLGLFWLMAFGSIALADRINLLQAEKAKADLEMRASEARYRGLVETMNDGLGVIDEENQITFVNSRLTEMLGYRPEEMLGRQITDFLDENNRQVMVRQLEERRTGIRSPYEVAWLRKDGRTLYSIVSPMPVFEDGRHYKGALGVVTDITERVLAGRNLEQRVDERTRELTTLLDVSHDITATQDLESILDLVLERLKTIVDYHGAVVFAEKDDCWNILGWHWPDPFSDPVLMEIAGSEIPALRREFEQRQSILLPQSSIDEQPQDGFGKIIRSLAKLDVPAPACWLGVPLLEKGVLFGILVLVHGHAGTFSEDQIKIAAAFANQISIAIENNRLYRQVRETAIVEERNRLARDLHDSVTQVLFSASLIAELLPQRLQRDPELALSSAAELRRLTHGALAEMRTMLLELRPEAITRGPLGELLTQLTEGMTSRVELAVDLYVENLPRLPADVQTAFYRIAQEALNNVIKHARANRVTISLSAAPPMGNQLAEDWKGEVKLIVQDDGIGYSPAVQPGEHLGLGIMRERAADIQAILTVERLPEYGTSVTLIWHR